MDAFVSLQVLAFFRKIPFTSTTENIHRSFLAPVPSVWSHQRILFGPVECSEAPDSPASSASALDYRRLLKRMDAMYMYSTRKITFMTNIL